MNTSFDHDVVIIGGGASGTALLYMLAKYTDIKRVALIEKYSQVGQVNSAAENNSQTLHVGDIETNYTLEKVRQVKPASMMVARYALALPEERSKKIIKKMQKMLLAVGEREVQVAEKRYEDLKSLFPDLRKLDRGEIAKVEPMVIKGRKEDEAVLALYTTEGYAVNFRELSKSLIEEAQSIRDKTVDVCLGTTAERIEKVRSGYVLHTSRGTYRSRVVVVDTDAYSLGFAKSLGYGEKFSLIPIAGSFYFADKVLTGKVYTVQEPGMPFAAVHGDPDLTHSGTRFGPTARFFPVLEARKYSSVSSYFAASGLQHLATWVSFYKILLDPVRFKYLARNIVYELPYVGKFFFAPQVRKIVPTISGFDLHRAHRYGGMRLQRVDTHTKELLLGEGKIVGDRIIFNMTPSPGASVCLYNAERDTKEIIKFFNGEFTFDQAHMTRDLCEVSIDKDVDVSLSDSYAS